MAIYLDCNATSPIDPQVRDLVISYMTEEYGNPGSRTHEFGQRANAAVQRARQQVATVVGAQREEVTFTSGATESNNLAILGLLPYGQRTKRKHIISTAIEHKAVLEPLEYAATQGFDVTLVRSTAGGWIEPEEVRKFLRPETLLVSVMHVNNETGVLQPLARMADVLKGHDAFFHVDAAQGFGKDIEGLRNSRIDLISVSGHKIYAPKGVGALIVRRRGYDRVPLTALQYGGGQEKGLRPGTVAVPLVAGLGLAAELAVAEHKVRAKVCRQQRKAALEALSRLHPEFNGDPSRTLPHVLNISVPGLDSEAVMLRLKDVAAISNGSACTSQSYEPSHVLRAMNLPEEIVRGALRISWCHMTPAVDWNEIAEKIQKLR
jgi:cysteine desulfurase